MKRFQRTKRVQRKKDIRKTEQGSKDFGGIGTHFHIHMNARTSHPHVHTPTPTGPTQVSGATSHLFFGMPGKSSSSSMVEVVTPHHSLKSGKPSSHLIGNRIGFGSGLG